MAFGVQLEIRNPDDFILPFSRVGGYPQLIMSRLVPLKGKYIFFAIRILKDGPVAF